MRLKYALGTLLGWEMVYTYDCDGEIRLRRVYTYPSGHKFCRKLLGWIRLLEGGKIAGKTSLTRWEPAGPMQREGEYLSYQAQQRRDYCLASWMGILLMLYGFLGEVTVVVVQANPKIRLYAFGLFVWGGGLWSLVNLVAALQGRVRPHASVWAGKGTS